MAELPEDRRGYEVYVEGRALELGLKAGRVELEKQWKALRRGWCEGGEGLPTTLSAAMLASFVNVVRLLDDAQYMLE